MRNLFTVNYAMAIRHAQRRADESNTTWVVSARDLDASGEPRLFEVLRFAGRGAPRLASWDVLVYPRLRTVRLGNRARRLRVTEVLRLWSQRSLPLHA